VSADGSRRVGRLGACVVAAFAAATVLVAAVAADTPVFSTTVFFRITYLPDCSFTVAIDGGINMDSTGATAPTTATIPPGPYQLSIRTPLPDSTWNTAVCEAANFSLSGPGVSYQTVLGSDLGPYSATVNETFAAGATYTMVDATHTASPVVFATTATGSSSSLLPPNPPPPAVVGSSEQPDFVGSGIVPYRGTLQASVARSGTVTLSSGGKPLVSVEAGRYEIVIKDASRRGGFFVQRPGGKPESLSGVAFTGTRVAHLDLGAGTWTFFATKDHEESFVVRA
jgi:hypothetical protein